MKTRLMPVSKIAPFPKRAVWVLTYHSKGRDNFILAAPSFKELQTHVREVFPRRATWKFDAQCYHPRTMKLLGSESL